MISFAKNYSGGKFSSMVSRLGIPPRIMEAALVGVVAILYSVTLFLAYKWVISPVYESQGMTYRSPDLFSHLAAIALVAIVVVLLPRRIEKASDFILWVFFVMAGAPAMLLPHYMQAISPGEASRLTLVISACMVMVHFLTEASPAVKMPAVASNLRRFAWIPLVALWMVTYVILFAKSGISLAWVDLYGGYDLRADFVAATEGSIIGYTLPWMFNVVNPLVIARGIYSRKWAWVIFGAIGQYLVFASTGQKAVLFSLAGIAGILILFKFSSRPYGVSVLGVASIGTWASIGVDRLIGTSLLTDMFVRRFLVVPGALVAGYVMVFSDAPRLWFSMVLGSESPFILPPTHLVGLEFAGDATTNANVSLLGDGYLQGGYAGILVEGLILVLVLWALNWSTRGLPIAVVAMVFFMPAISLASGAITTVILTHGFGFAIAACAILPRDGWEKPGVAKKRPSSGTQGVAVGAQ